MIENSDNIYTSLANLYSAKIMYLENQLSILSISDHIISHSDDSEIVDMQSIEKQKFL